MVSSDTFAEFLRELLGPLGRVTMRRMNETALCSRVEFRSLARSASVIDRSL